MAKGFISRDIAGNRSSQEEPRKSRPSGKVSLRKNPDTALSQLLWAFQVMTTSRPEIEIAGSYDGKTWKNTSSLETR